MILKFCMGSVKVTKILGFQPKTNFGFQCLSLCRCGLLAWDNLLGLEEDDFLSKLLRFHSALQMTLGLDVPGFDGEPGGEVWLPVDAVCDGGRPSTPLASS